MTSNVLREYLSRDLLSYLQLSDFVDSDPNSHMIAECKSITCLRDNTFKITIKNCTSETLHFLCLNGKSYIMYILILKEKYTRALIRNILYVFGTISDTRT